MHWVKETYAEKLQIGFVPTMGALHQGHLALVNKARQQNHMVVASIFVNPLQFNNPQDLEKYPRNPEKDISLLESAGCDVVFYPEVEEMYPDTPSEEYDFGQMDKVMEGRFRPGHFNGVAIVVKRLFDLVRPHKAYFGQKDFQQLQIIRKLVSQENLTVEIISCPTIREADGLAMSSRNVRLTPEQRRQAPHIYRILKAVSEQYPQKTVSEIKTWVDQQLAQFPLMEPEYFEIVSAETLQPVSQTSAHHKVIACIAVHLGQVRLIDNLMIN